MGIARAEASAEDLEQERLLDILGDEEEDSEEVNVESRETEAEREEEEPERAKAEAEADLLAVRRIQR